MCQFKGKMKQNNPYIIKEQAFWGRSLFMSQREYAGIGHPVSLFKRVKTAAGIHPPCWWSKRGGCYKRERGKDNGGKFPRRCKKKGGYWMPKNELHTHNKASLSIFTRYRYCKNTPNSNWHFKNYVETLRECTFSSD